GRRAGRPPGPGGAAVGVRVPARRGHAVGQGQRRAGVVGPLPGLQAVRPAAAVAGDGGEAAGAAELHGGPQGVAHGQADQGPSQTVVHRWLRASGRLSEAVPNVCFSGLEVWPPFPPRAPPPRSSLLFFCGGRASPKPPPPLPPPSRTMSFASALSALRPTLPCYVALTEYGLLRITRDSFEFDPNPAAPPVAL